MFYALDATLADAAFAKLAELSERAAGRALIVCAPEREAQVRAAKSLKGLELYFEHAQQDPPHTRGLPALALEPEPAQLLDLIEDRRISVVIYVPKNETELRHFTQAYPECASV